VSLEAQPVVIFVVEVGVVATFAVVGLFIFFRKPDDWLAMLVSAGFVTYSTWASPAMNAILAVQPKLQGPVSAVHAIGMGAALIFLYVFPDGRFVPGISRLTAALWAAMAAAWVTMPASVFNLSNPYRLPMASFALLELFLATGLLAQLFRFWRVSGPVQRQQSKWVLFGVVVGLSTYTVFGLERVVVPTLGEPLMANVVYELVGLPLFLLSLIAVPLSFTISILRYRLWDIDLIINRALVYGSLTAILAGLYVASVGFFQRLFVAVTGDRSEAAVVLTTLMVAAGFTPVKSWLQTIIDRYVKEAPDPSRDLNTFGEQMRSLTTLMDRDALTRKLLDDCVKAFGAESGALYLNSDGHASPDYTVGDWKGRAALSHEIQAGGMFFGHIALGPRASGQGYSDHDHQTLRQIVELTARVLRLSSPIDSPWQVTARVAGWNGA
jgi:hypothetical protein